MLCNPMVITHSRLQVTFTYDGEGTISGYE